MCWSLCSLARHSIAKGATVQLRKMPRPLCMVSYASICAARRVWFKTDPHHSLRGLFGIDAVGIQRVSHYYLLYVYEKNIHCYINYDIYIYIPLIMCFWNGQLTTCQTTRHYCWFCASFACGLSGEFQCFLFILVSSLYWVVGCWSCLSDLPAKIPPSKATRNCGRFSLSSRHSLSAGPAVGAVLALMMVGHCPWNITLQ